MDLVIFEAPTNANYIWYSSTITSIYVHVWTQVVPHSILHTKCSVRKLKYT